jgi:hypothetical protein
MAGFQRVEDKRKIPLEPPMAHAKLILRTQVCPSLSFIIYCSRGPSAIGPIFPYPGTQLGWFNLNLEVNKKNSVWNRFGEEK